jgi:hypothetical protein
MRRWPQDPADPAPQVSEAVEQGTTVRAIGAGERRGA